MISVITPVIASTTDQTVREGDYNGSCTSTFSRELYMELTAGRVTHLY